MAGELAARFEQAFWIEDEHYYAIGLDRDKRQADAIGSNAGQCLWTGIVDDDKAVRAIPIETKRIGSLTPTRIGTILMVLSFEKS